MKLFQRLADDIATQIRSGTLRLGERIPSVREISRDRTLSTATVVRAYEWLEGQGLIETRPRSGFYVSAQWKTSLTSMQRPSRSTRVDVSELVFEVLESVRDRQLVPFGSAFPSPLLFPMTRLARCLSQGARRMDQWGTLDDLPPGSLELRRQIARRYLRSGARVAPEEIIITSGALEALNLSLQILTRPGDIVAVESPAFYGCLQAIEALRLRAVEIPSHPRHGVDVSAFAAALERHPIDRKSVV